MEQPDVRRVRAQWDCDGENLLITVRGHGRGELSADAPSVARLDCRVQALTGQMRVEVMSGWGADVNVTLPLVRRPDRQGMPPAGIWSPGDWKVLQHLAAGRRNRIIASALNISENTVKFHLRNLFKELGVGSRTEAIALAHRHGVR
jgi:hypothetical protein